MVQYRLYLDQYPFHQIPGDKKGPAFDLKTAQRVVGVEHVRLIVVDGPPEDPKTTGEAWDLCFERVNDRSSLVCVREPYEYEPRNKQRGRGTTRRALDEIDVVGKFIRESIHLYQPSTSVAHARHYLLSSSPGGRISREGLQRSLSGLRRLRRATGRINYISRLFTSRTARRHTDWSHHTSIHIVVYRPPVAISRGRSIRPESTASHDTVTHCTRPATAAIDCPSV